jgi:hypothetical protein
MINVIIASIIFIIPHLFWLTNFAEEFMSWDWIAVLAALLWLNVATVAIIIARIWTIRQECKRYLNTSDNNKMQISLNAVVYEVKIDIFFAIWTFLSFILINWLINIDWDQTTSISLVQKCLIYLNSIIFVMNVYCTYITTSMIFWLERIYNKLLDMINFN